MGGGQAPEGFLICDGSAISRITYKDLFDVIGTKFGSGNGSTTFNVPNLVNKVPRGTSTNYIGSSGGTDEVTLEIKHLPSHNHGLGEHTHTLSHTHTVTPKGTISGGSYSFSSESHSHGAGTYKGTTENSGIAALISGRNKNSAQESITNDHGMSFSDRSVSISGSSGGATVKGSVSVSTNPSFTGTKVTSDLPSESTTSKADGNTNDTGSDTAFSIVPSYVAFAYIIKY